MEFCFCFLEFHIYTCYFHEYLNVNDCKIINMHPLAMLILSFFIIEYNNNKLIQRISLDARSIII